METRPYEQSRFKNMPKIKWDMQSSWIRHNEGHMMLAHAALPANYKILICKTFSDWLK